MYVFPEFRENPPMTFWFISQTNRQTSGNEQPRCQKRQRQQN